MIRSVRPRTWSVVTTAVVAGSMLTASLVAVPATAATPTAQPAGTYLVRTALDPVVGYDGGVTGLAATKPSAGHKIDPRAAGVVEYADHLRARHDAVLNRAGAGKAAKLYDYAYAFDGFAARLTPDQAARLETTPGVLSVTRDRLRSVDTSSAPGFLGLDRRGGLWDQLGGPTGTDRRDGAGEDIVIGVVDSGIWPQSGSFSDRDRHGRQAYGPVEGFRGTCAPAGDGSWDAGSCNRKLVGARHFNAGWGGDEGLETLRPWEFSSPRDYNGHGTHTASTAGGNHGVDTSGPAGTLGPISGIAPRARIAAYKALWSTEDGYTAHGYTSDLVAAIDQAVADGVDVINYSVSGTTSDFLDPVELAFLYAAEAGVFVAAAAGNSGPASATVAHPGPWLTTVAAGTHSRQARGAVRLGDGRRYAGPSSAVRVGPAPLVDGATAARPGAESWQAELCYPASANGGEPVLDRQRVAGRVVVCDEGNVAPSAKSRAVKEAGGVGMILTNRFSKNPSPGVHLVPTVVLAGSDWEAVKSYAATGGAKATVEQATIGSGEAAPYTASFSSRGPLFAGGGDLLKPDLIAPGQDILAAVAPPGHDGLSFDLASGTSMAAPHVAGLAALLKDRHPAWSPMMIKSSLMTTGYDVRDGAGTSPDVIFRQGAGHVRPNDAADPGLVYDSDVEDWIAFLCGTTDGVAPASCDALAAAGHSLDPSDLNAASIAIGPLSGPRTVTRKVTNVGDRTATYTAGVEGLEGIDVTVSPRRLTLKPGQTKAFTVRIARETAEPNRYYGGRLTWTDGRHRVRTPIVVRLTRPADTGWRVDALAGGPTFDASTQTGYVQPQLPINPGSTAGDGLGVGTVLRFQPVGGGNRAVRWEPGGWTELEGLGRDADGGFQTFAYATAPDGTAVGNAFAYGADGADRGNRPVRWDAGSTTAVELESLGAGADGTSFGTANAVNARGTIAGDVTKYLPDGTDLGRRAVRWEAGGTAVTELGNLGTGPGGETNVYSYAINERDDVVGMGIKRDGNTFYGTRAIRWDAGSAAATELGVLGTEADGSSYAQANDVSDDGTAVGHSSRYAAGESKGQAAVRWAAGGTAATELASLGTDADGITSASAYAVNNTGTTVGSSSAYGAGGAIRGTRAVVWPADRTAPTELEQLEIDPSGQAGSTAFDVNGAGLVVGQALAYSEQKPTDPGNRAVLWTPDGKLVDLTSLLPSDSGWTLSRAMSISDTNWVTGIGLYDPDGAGALSPYFRLFLMQLAPTDSPR